jgi:putative FmdB family regulatory protein
MPTYDYKCTACDHQFEAFHSISADALSKCPICGAGIQRLIGGGTGLIFKGSGFYITDYKNKSGNKSGQGEQKVKSD